MSITGNLKTMQLPELLQWLASSNKSGTLVIDNEVVEKKVSLKDGRIISSASTDPREYLGSVLVSQGYISDRELSQAIQMQQKTGMLLGKILVTIGAVSEADLHRLLRFKAEESIYDIFSWPEGEFRFLDGDLPKDNMIPISLDVQALILEGVQRVDEWRRIRDFIPSPAAIPVGLTDLTAYSEGQAPNVQRILTAIDDRRTIADIQTLAHSSEFKVCRALLEPVRQGQIKIVSPDWERPADADEDRGNDQMMVAVGNIDAPMLIAQGKALLAREEYEAGIRSLRAALALEPDLKQAKEALVLGEEIIEARVSENGLTLDAIPKLARSMAEMTSLELTPQQGFLLTRIDGNYNVKALFKICSMPRIEALLVLWRLLTDGHITV